MLNIFIFVVCLLFIALSLFIDKQIYNPIVLFNIWWGITILVSGFGLYGIEVPSIKTYLIMLAAIISFDIPFIYILIVSGKKAFEVKTETATDDNVKTLINYLIGLQLLIIIDLIRHSIRVFQLLASGLNYERIRYEYFYTDHIMSMYDNLISNYIVTPTITFSMILIALLLLEKHYSKILIFTTTLCVGLSAFFSGGRGILLTFGLIMSLAYLIQSSRSPIKTKSIVKVKLLVVLAIVIGFLIYITMARSTSGNFNEIFHTGILYFTAPYIYFEKLYNIALQDNVLLFGGAFFGGVIDFFMLIYKFVSGTDISTMGQHVAKYNQTALFVGVNSEYCAFPTMVYTFLYDFSYLGVILGPLLFGTLAMSSYKKMRTSNRLAYKGIYIMIGLMIYQSVMKWEGTSAYPWAVIAMFFTYEYFTKKGLSQNNRFHRWYSRTFRHAQKGISS